MKFINIKIAIAALVATATVGCQNFDDLRMNPNVVSETSPIPPNLLLGRITYATYTGGGSEAPFDIVQRWNQYTISNETYYGGQNGYTWTNSSTIFDILKNVEQMEKKAKEQLGTNMTAYAAIGKFYRAYISIWLSQRVGDIPMSEAGQGLDNLTPKYDSQHDVYLQSLQLLDSANIMFNQLVPIAATSITAQIDGDIFFGNSITKWQKAINTYKLRVLISMSKRADDTPDLKIKERFAAVINNPVANPIMASNSDNMVFNYNVNYNPYPHNKTDAYNDRQNIGYAYLKLTTSTQDPRTFIVATPAPALLASTTVNDFGAYAGSDISMNYSDLATNSAAGKYSFLNYNRYYLSNADRSTNLSFAGPEPYIIMGYAEMNFNIAEAINRGWVSGANAATYYNNGINASLAFYGLTDGKVLTIGDVTGKTLGTVTVSVTDFLNNTEVIYKGDNADGLEQILNQKYIAFFENSAYEAFYNHRRTGFPTDFISAGAGINAAQKVPVRWLYPNDEVVYNAANYKAAIQSQYNGTDDLNTDIWLLK